MSGEDGGKRTPEGGGEKERDEGKGVGFGKRGVSERRGKQKRRGGGALNENSKEEN